MENLLDKPTITATIAAMNENYFYKPYQPKTLLQLPCSVCESNDNRLVAAENNLNIVRCIDCGYVFVNPRPSATDLEEFYRDYYPEQEGLPESWSGEMEPIFRDIHRRVCTDYHSGRILDIGSSYGHFLAKFDAGKWQATGIEPSPTATDYCQAQFPDIKTYTANFEDVPLSAHSFDVITSFYVLEHVFDPRDFMQRVHSLLADGGLAVIRIPYTRPFFPFAKLLGRPLMYAPMHLNDFAPQHFEQMCSDIGFSQVDSSIGANRLSSNAVEKTGAVVFSALGRIYEAVSPGDFRFPYAGAYTYLLSK